MKSYLTVLLLALTGLGVSACNTTEGLGKDVEAAGEAIEEAAEDTREKLEDM